MSVADKWSADVFRCPLCRSGTLTLQGKSLVCLKGHCFDIAAKGYVNFIPGQKKTKYSRELFENRRIVYAGGFYDEAADMLSDAVKRYGGGRVLDAGCGEGYFTRRLESALCDRAFALDIEKEAIRLASIRGDSCAWMVADLANIPLRDNSVDIVLNVFTPANLAEFRRVLCKGGVVIKAVPGGRHLQEIRRLAGKQDHDGGRAAAHFLESFRLIERMSYSKSFPVTNEEKIRFLRMTPLMFDTVFSDDIHLDGITVEMEILVGGV